MHRHTIVSAVAPLALVAAAASPCAAEGQWTLGVQIDDRWIEGTPLAWSPAQISLLGRDGRFWSISPSQVTDYQKVADAFRPYSAQEMRQVLLHEFGPQYDVTGTRHYLVVHPAGQETRWADAFESLHSNMVHYFSIRGARPSRAAFPLVAVVFADERDFQRYAAQNEETTLQPRWGYYSLASNRILMYDAADGTSGRDAIATQTIVHEAAHQTAFNVGLHSRTAAPPLWVAEGLATLFEAEGIADAGRNPNQSDRVNRHRLATLRQHGLRDDRGATLARLISSDAWFRSEPIVAYAHAWALSFFLAESHPGQYVRYLQLTSANRAASDDAARRTRDFQAAFGSDLALVESRWLRFIQELR